MGKTYKIATIPGDGTGPEVVREAIKVLNAAASKGGFKLEFTEFDFGAARYLKTGETLPDSAIGEFKKFDSMFLGAIGHPDVKPGILEAGILLKIRFALDQYINLRPVKLYPNVETPLRDKGPGAYRFRRDPREHRRHLHRPRRRDPGRHHGRDRHPAHGL